jgi:hypothetical protein
MQWKRGYSHCASIWWFVHHIKQHWQSIGQLRNERGFSKFGQLCGMEWCFKQADALVSCLFWFGVRFN